MTEFRAAINRKRKANLRARVEAQTGSLTSLTASCVCGCGLTATGRIQLSGTEWSRGNVLSFELLDSQAQRSKGNGSN